MCTLPVARKPSYGTDRAGGKKKAIAVACLQVYHTLGEVSEEGQPRAVVIGERGVAHMGRKEEFVVRCAPVQIFAVCEGSILEGRVDHHLVGLVDETL